MPNLTISLLFAAALWASCSSATAAERAAAPKASSAVHCDKDAPGALVARRAERPDKPKGHAIVATLNLKLERAQYIEGSCTAAIVSYSAGHAWLPSADAFVVWNDGTVRLFKPNGIVGSHTFPTKTVRALRGYDLLRAESLGWRPHAAGKRKIYLGLFKGKSDYLIARFDMIEGKTSKTAEILIRATAPISGLGFLGAPDTPEGGIGFVQHAGPNKAWLYSYSWQHGPLLPLKF